MKIDVLGVRIDALTTQQILEKIAQSLNAGGSVFIATPYSESIVAARTDGEFRSILNSADICLADGIGVVWAANFLESRIPQKTRLAIAGKLIFSLASIVFRPEKIRYPIPEKISGSQFIWDLAGLAEDRGESIFVLGGFGQTPDKIARIFKSRYPNLRVAGTYGGSPDEPGIVEKINAAKADYLFVAYGPKRQEKWIYENRKTLNSRLLIGLGGTFDYIAGKRPIPPGFIARRGLEWLWRLLTQPWRVCRIARGVFGLIYYSFKAKLQV